MEEARKCMDELKTMKHSVELFNSPAHFFTVAKILTANTLKTALDYSQSWNADPKYVKQIETELQKNQNTILEIFEKYKEGDNCPSMKEDAHKLIEATRELFMIIQKACPEQQNEADINAFKGLVSKA